VGSVTVRVKMTSHIRYRDENEVDPVIKENSLKKIEHPVLIG
jgi:hypothetical protein